ncbi:hypothetical protein BaRGS_00005728 [Batillaria attramentaria]|uniref:Cytochrome P450 n=1 Tax=Batillaria attramentaria TaxID=370345 RepID=A0ABD0LUC8_9CAEN
MASGKTDDILEYEASLVKKFPKYSRFWMGPFQPMINLYHPDTVKPVLKIAVSFAITSGPKPWNYDLMAPWLGRGLLVSGGAKWARSRRLLTPAFHFDILKPYVAVKNTACNVMLGKLKKYADEKTSVEMYGIVRMCTLDVIMQCAFSYKDDIQVKGDSHPYVHAVHELSVCIEKRILNPLVHYDIVYHMTERGKRWKKGCDYVHQFSEKIIEARKQTLEKEGPPKKRYLDFLDILLTAKDDSGQGMTPLDIRNEVDTFMFAGHDTTSSAISWTLYSLCEHPEYQQRVQEEVDHILQGRQSDDIQWSDLSRFEFLTLVLKEAMRLHSPVPIISRRLTEPLQIEDITLPADTHVNVNIYNLHHNPAVWSDPCTFQPERFHPHNMQDMDPYAFLPFSAGPRNCIGQHFAMNEAKIVLTRLLRRFSFSLDPDHKVERAMAMVMQTENGIKMFVTNRTPTV